MALFALIKLPPRVALKKNWDSGVVLGGDFVWVYFLSLNCFSLKTDLILGLKVCLRLPWSDFKGSTAPSGSGLCVIVFSGIIMCVLR